MNIGIIGFGNIATAIVKGLLRQDPAQKDHIYCSAAHYEKCAAKAAELGVHACRDNHETVKQADLVIVAVKPYLVKDVLTDVREDLKGKILISVASGIYYDDLYAVLGEDTHFICTEPNTPISVAQGVILCEDRYTLDEGEMQIFKDLFGPIALLEFLKTKDMSAAGCISGCSPAYAAMFIEALGDAGVKNGLTRAAAYRLAAQTLAGTGIMALSENAHPGVLKDAVCSPGGKTIRGVASLEESGFRGTVIKAIDAILQK